MQLAAQIIVAVWQLYSAISCSRKIADGSTGEGRGVETLCVALVMLVQIGILYAAGSFSLLVK